MKKYRCMNEQCIVKRLESEDELSKGGIVKPEIARQRSQRGKVFVSGIDEIKAGDIVLFTRFGGTEIELNGQDYTLCHATQIYVIEINENS